MVKQTTLENGDNMESELTLAKRMVHVILFVVHLNTCYTGALNLKMYLSAITF